MKKLLSIICLIMPVLTFAQEDLMKLMTDSNEIFIRSATFKATRVINGHSVETVGKNNLDFIISHRFDRINRGFEDFFGLDAATNRLGLEYGINDRLMLGMGRSSFQKTFDYFAKYKLIRQTFGAVNVPLSVSILGGYMIRTQNISPKLSSKDRSSYTAQILIARKFSEALSLQLSPTLIHRNRPDIFTDNQTVFASGIGGRMKLSKRVSVNGEYNYVLPNQIDDSYSDNLSFSFDIETGGHVFQLLFTNSFGMTERQFITETTGNWGNGNIHFGFNISRTFAFGKKLPSKQ